MLTHSSDVSSRSVGFAWCWGSGEQADLGAHGREETPPGRTRGICGGQTGRAAPRPSAASTLGRRRRDEPAPGTTTCWSVHPVFDTLSDRLTSVLQNLRGKGQPSDPDTDATARECGTALQEADVPRPVGPARRIT